MSDEEEYEEEEEEEENEEQQEEEVKKDSGPNLNEFAQYEKYGSYYKNTPFGYYGSTQPRNLYDRNSYTQPGYYPNPYAQYQSNFQCLQQPPKMEYGYPPQKYQQNFGYTHPNQQQYYFNQRPPNGLNMISDQVNQINHFASKIPYGAEDLPVRDKEFEEYLRFKNKFQIEQDRYRAGRQLARENYDQTNPQDWRTEIDKRVSPKKLKGTFSNFSEDDYKEFMEFKKFKMMRTQTNRNEVPESNQKLNSYQKPRDEEPIINIAQPRRQSLPNQEQQVIQFNDQQQDIPPVIDIKPKTAKDLYKRKTGQKQVPEVNMVKVDPEQQKEIDEAIKVLLQR